MELHFHFIHLLWQQRVNIRDLNNVCINIPTQIYIHLYISDIYSFIIYKFNRCIINFKKNVMLSIACYLNFMSFFKKIYCFYFFYFLFIFMSLKRHLPFLSPTNLNGNHTVLPPPLPITPTALNSRLTNQSYSPSRIGYGIVCGSIGQPNRRFHNYAHH